jgi:hypothetical protein
VDGAGNWNALHDQFNVVDITPPTISNLATSPSEIESGGNVNISAFVTDNYLLTGVWISVIDPAQQASNSSMSTGVRYYFDQTYSDPGDYLFTIWASDSSGNWAFAGGFFAVNSPAPRDAYVHITSPEEGSEFIVGEVVLVEGWLREVGTDRGVEDERLIIALETVDGQLVGEEVYIESRANGRIIETFVIPEEAEDCAEYHLRVYSTETNTYGDLVEIRVTGCQDDDMPIWIFPLILVIIIVVTTLAILLILLWRRRRKEEQAPVQLAQTREIQEQASDDVEP